jgi:hypothetical protein
MTPVSPSCPPDGSLEDDVLSQLIGTRAEDVGSGLLEVALVVVDTFLMYAEKGYTTRNDTETKGGGRMRCAMAMYAGRTGR